MEPALHCILSAHVLFPTGQLKTSALHGRCDAIHYGHHEIEALAGEIARDDSLRLATLGGPVSRAADPGPGLGGGVSPVTAAIGQARVAGLTSENAPVVVFAPSSGESSSEDNEG